MLSKTDDFLRYARHADDFFVSYRNLDRLLKEKVPLDGIRVRVFDRADAPFRRGRSIHARHFFSRSFSDGLGLAYTVAYSALQIAYCLGFRTVYLFGLDLSLEGRYYSETIAQPQGLHDNWDEGILAPFSLISRMISDGEWNVINASPSSMLPESILPRMDPNSALQLPVRNVGV